MLLCISQKAQRKQLLYVLSMKICAVFKNNTGQYIMCMSDLLPKINEVISAEVRNVSKDALPVKYVESWGGSVSEVGLLISTLKFYLSIKISGFLINMSIQFASVHA